MSTKPKRPRGRQPGPLKPDDEKTVIIGIRLYPAQRDWLKAQPNASKWIRQQIDKARH